MATRRQKEIIDLVASLGGDARAFRRERARKARAIIAEFYSPPRVSALARELPSYGIAPGLALDLTVPDENGDLWDFSIPAMRAKAERLLDEQAPLLLRLLLLNQRLSRRALALPVAEGGLREVFLPRALITKYTTITQNTRTTKK